MRAMPIHEYQCEGCGRRFEELIAGGGDLHPCADCGSDEVRRLPSAVSPPGRQPRGAKVRDSESRRREREASRSERIAEARQARGQS